MNQTKPFFAFSNLIHFIYTFILLFLSGEVLYALFITQSTMTTSDEFYYFISFTRKPLVLLLNSLVILAWLIHTALLLKAKPSFFTTQSWSLIHQIAKIIALFFIPFALYCLLKMIPFGDAQIRTLFLNTLQLNLYKTLGFIGSISIFLCALTNGFVCLTQLNITPRRPQFIVKLLALIWTANLIYLLFLNQSQ